MLLKSLISEITGRFSLFRITHTSYGSFFYSNYFLKPQIGHQTKQCSRLRNNLALIGLLVQIMMKIDRFSKVKF